MSPVKISHIVLLCVLLCGLLAVAFAPLPTRAHPLDGTRNASQLEQLHHELDNTRQLLAACAGQPRDTWPCSAPEEVSR